MDDNKIDYSSFIDEPVVSTRHSADALFATTVSGVVWVSFSKGKTWRLRSDVLKDVEVYYQRKLAELARLAKLRDTHIEYKQDLEEWYREKIADLNDN